MLVARDPTRASVGAPGVGPGRSANTMPSGIRLATHTVPNTMLPLGTRTATSAPPAGAVPNLLAGKSSNAIAFCSFTAREHTRRRFRGPRGGDDDGRRDRRVARVCLHHSDPGAGDRRHVPL